MIPTFPKSVDLGGNALRLHEWFLDQKERDRPIQLGKDDRVKS